MKLHLPKMLLTAVLSACSVAWGDFSGPVNSYAEGGTITTSPTVTEDTAYTVQTGDVAVSAENYNIKFSDGYTSGDRETGLGTITAESLWIAQGRYVFNAGNDLSGVGSVYINGASALQFSVTSDATVSSNLSIGTSTYNNNGSWSGHPNLCNAAIIFGYWQGAGKTITLNGSLEIQENARITFQYGNNAILNGELKGSGNLDLAYQTDAAGSLTIAGDSSSYTGALSFTGGKVNVKLGNSAVQLGGLSGGSSTNSIILADGTSASTLTLNVAENASYTYTGTLGTGISLEKTGAGTQIFSGVTLSNDITVTQGTLTLTSVTTTGEMSISGAGTLNVTNTITNSGTLSLDMDSISIGELSAFTVKENGATSYSLGNENGFLQQSGAKLYLVQGGGATTADGAVATLGGDEYTLTADDSGIWFTTGDFTSAAFYITNGEIEVVGVGGTGTETGASEYVIQGGTMKLTSGTVDGTGIDYTRGSIQLDDSATLTGLSATDDTAKIGAISGSGTIEVSVAADWNTTIATSEGFTGTVYVNGGSRFTYDSAGLGSILKLATGVNMQVNNGGSLTDTLQLESGNHEVHVNGTNTFNITGTVSGDGVFDKRGGSSTVCIKESATVGNYLNTTGTTYVQGSATVESLTTAGGTVNVEGGSVTTLRTTGGTTNVSGGVAGHIVTTGGTLNLTGTATIDGSGSTGNYRKAGIYANGGTVNVGNGTDAATVTLTRIEMGDTAAGSLNIRQNATLVVTGSDVVGGDGSGENAYWKTGFLLSEWSGQSTLNVTGTLLVQNAHVAHGDNTAYVNIENGGVIATKGLYGARNHGTANANGRIQLNLKDGGTLILGEGGIDVSNLDGSLAAGTIGISADATIADNLALSSTTGTTFDTQKWVWGENGASISQGTEGGTLTISGAIADYSTTTGEGEEAVTTTSTGKLIKAGAGTLKLTATNTYSGGTDINGGTLEVGANNALGIGEVNIGSAGTLTIANGATFTNTIKGSGTYALGSSAALQGTLDSTWTGTVSLNGATLTDANLNTYGNANSTVELSSATGSLAEGTINTNVKFTSGTSGGNATPGMRVTTTTGKTVTFAGSVTSNDTNGNLVVEAPAENISGTDTYVFTGDVSNWTGKVVGGSDVNVKYEGNATSVKNDIAVANNSTVNVTYGGDKAITVNGYVDKTPWSGASGTINIKVENTSTEGVTFTNTVEVSSTNLADGTSASFNGTSNLGSLTLGDGATITGTGNLTIGELILDLQSYTTDFSQIHTLVSTTGTLNFTGSLDAYQGATVGEYTATVEQSGNSITLSFSEIVTPDTNDITTTVTSFVDITDGMLTLNVGADLADATKVLIEGISDDIMKQILGDANLPEGGMVGITLAGTNDSSFTATADQMIGFQGKDGIYYGAQVGSAWQYQAAYIPEPTTATLSLLALAGLAARRRRKA